MKCMIRRCDAAATTHVTLDRTGGPKTGTGLGGGHPTHVEGSYCYPHAFERMTDPAVLPGHELADFGDTWTFRPIPGSSHNKQEQR